MIPAVRNSHDNSDFDLATEDESSGKEIMVASGSNNLAPDSERKKLIADTLDDFGQAALSGRVEKKDEIIQGLPKPDEHDLDGTLVNRDNIASGVDINGNILNKNNGNKGLNSNKLEEIAIRKAKNTSLKNLFSAISGSDVQTKSVVPTDRPAKSEIQRATLVSD